MHHRKPSKNNIVKFRQIEQIAINIPNLTREKNGHLPSTVDKRKKKKKHFRDKIPNKEVSSLHQNDDLERERERD